MKTYRVLFVIAVLAALAVVAAADTTVIPSGTVIPAVIDNQLSSASARPGDTFTARISGAAGFPDNTKFVGTVETVKRATSKSAGEIDVGFVSAELPNGTTIPINGQLASLDSNSVSKNPNTGMLTAKPEAKKSTGKFIAYGAGGGLLIGSLTGKHGFMGALLGAAGGYLYGRKHDEAAYGRDAVVPAGTRFGVLLQQDVALNPSPPSAVGGVATPIPAGVESGWRVSFKTLQPVMVGNELLVPLRSVMNQIDTPFDYDMNTKSIRVSLQDSTFLHTVGTRVLYRDGTAVSLDAPSRIINGVVYVPTSFIEKVTGRATYWNARSGILRIE
jgi:hypothetical protein